MLGGMALKDIIGKVLGERAVALELDLARGVLVARPSNPLQAIALINSPTLSGLREQLAQAAGDQRVLGLIVHAAPAQLQLAHAEEIAGLIEAFGTKKPTVAWAESFGELTSGLTGYRIAAAAHEIWVQPTGMLSIEGVTLEASLLKGLLTKAGIEPQFGQRHEYKTAADRFAADDFTPAHRDMMQRLSTSLVDSLAEAIAQRRNLTVEQVWEGINSSPLTPQQALELGLIDHIGYRDEVYAATLRSWEATPEQLCYVQRHTLAPTLLRKLRHSKQVGVVTLRGPIVMGRGVRTPMAQEQAGADVVEEQLRAALRDDHISAVVFEVDSPGGSAVASDFIRRSVVRLREVGKPVVVHMGAVAASGGYYVSMAANEIVAQAATLTGSIGVLGGKLVTAGLYDKLGLLREIWPSGQAAAMFSTATRFTQQDWQRLNDWLDRVYHDFTTLAAQDRGMAYDDLEKNARGRVWTGADAVALGLVDHLGGQTLAVERACQLAGLDPATTRVRQLGGSGLLNLIKPAESSETSSGGANLAGGEALLSAVLQQAGLSPAGVLSVPWRLALC